MTKIAKFPKKIVFYKYKNNIHYIHRQKITNWVNSLFLFNGNNTLDLNIYENLIIIYFIKIIYNEKSNFKQNSLMLSYRSGLSLSITNIKQEMINSILEISQNDELLQKIDDPVFVNSMKDFHFNYSVLNIKPE